MLLLSIFGYFFKKKLKKNNIKTNNYFLGIYDFKNIEIFKKNYEIFKKEMTSISLCAIQVSVIKF